MRKILHKVEWTAYLLFYRSFSRSTALDVWRTKQTSGSRNVIFRGRFTKVF